MGFILTGRYFVVEREEVDMERYDARKETFEEIEIFDTLALFSSGRIQRESVPKGFCCYEVRHDDECMGIQMCIRDRCGR